MTKYRDMDGNEIKEDGKTRTLDHTTTTLSLTIRHMNTLDIETIKRLLNRYEVIDVFVTDRTYYCKEM